MAGFGRSLGRANVYGAIMFVAWSISIGSSLAGAATHARPSFAWPASLVTVGNGYPAEGDACRRLGESPATANYLDHTATLIGCPGGADSATVRAMLLDHRAHVVGNTDGVTLISIFQRVRRSPPPDRQ